MSLKLFNLAAPVFLLVSSVAQAQQVFQTYSGDITFIPTNPTAVVLYRDNGPLANPNVYSGGTPGQPPFPSPYTACATLQLIPMGNVRLTVTAGTSTTTQIGVYECAPPIVGDLTLSLVKGTGSAPWPSQIVLKKGTSNFRP